MTAADRGVVRSFRALAVPATWLSATLAALIVMLPVLGLGLFVPLVILAPSTVLVGGLAAGVAAGWVRNGFAADGSRTRLLPTAGAAVVGLIVVALAWLGSLATGPSGPMLIYALLAAAGCGTGAAWAADRWRGPGRVGRDVVVSLALLGIGVATIVTILPLLCSTVVTCRA